MEFQCNLIFTRSALRHIVERYFETGLAVTIETQYGTIKIGCAPIPTAQRQFFFRQILLQGIFHISRHFFLFARFEAHETVQQATFHKYAQSEKTNETLQIDQINVADIDLIHFAGFIVFENDILIGQFETSHRLFLFEKEYEIISIIRYCWNEWRMLNMLTM